jgi:hypothetical protein
MDVITFTCQYCGEQQEWDTPESASVAASWHLFDAHPLRWLTDAGHRRHTDPRPLRPGHRAYPPRIDWRLTRRHFLLGA